MQSKVQEDAYARVDQFKFDFLLVTGNAKIFNLPESFYYTQAQKLEDWGLKAIEAAEAKGIRQHGDDPSPEPQPAVRPALTPIQMAQMSHTASQSPTEASPSSASASSVKRFSIKLKRPPSMGGAQPTAPPERKKSKKDRTSSASKPRSRAPSRPLISSSLSRPPTLADSPSPASTDDEAGSDQRADSDASDSDAQASSNSESDEESSDDEGEHEPSTYNHAAARHVNAEQGSDDDDDDSPDASDEEDDDDDDDDTRSRRTGSMSLDLTGSYRDSETPIPGGGSMRKKALPPLKPKVQQKRNAPIKAEDSISLAIDKIVQQAKAKGLPMSVHDAALELRQTRRNQAGKLLTYTLDGSLDLDQCKAQERAEILATFGQYTDEATGAPMADDGMPDLLAAYPLHPDAQKHLEKLTRLAPSDVLGAATNTDARPKESTGSHYEHALPFGHRRMPMSVPTAYAETPRPQGPDGVFIPGDGLVQRNASELPYSWPHPLRSTGKDYEPPAQMDPLYPEGTEDPAANRPKYRNKDFERENEGQATLRDWTYPHVSYSRMWDGSGDLAVWKDVDGALRSAGFGMAEPFQRWEESRALRTREMINAEEKQAVHLCADKAVRADEEERAKRARMSPTAGSRGKALPDDESELGLLKKLLELDEEITAGGQAMQGNQRKTHAKLLPSERIRHTINGADFLTRELWGEPTIPGIRPGHPGLTPIPVPGGVADGEMWARSVQSFIEGAIGVVESDCDSGSESEEGAMDVDRAAPMEPVKTAAESASETKGQVRAEDAMLEVKQEGDEGGLFGNEDGLASSLGPPRRRSREEVLLDAHVQGMILDRRLFEYVRDEVVAPQSHFRNLTTTALLGENLARFEERHLTGEVAKGDDGLKKASDVDEVTMREVEKALEGSPAGTPLVPSIHPAMRTITPDSAAWVLLHLPLIWSSTSYLKRLLDAPMHIDTEHLMLKREDWMQPEVPPEYSSEQKSASWPVRMEEKDWTGPRIAAALQQYGEILLMLDAKIRSGQAGDEWTVKMKNFIRLALLAIARLAPGWAIKVSRR